jgi:hypothetical protein
MQGEDDLRGLAKIMAFMRAVSILLVLMHLYWFCYGFFIERGWTLEIINKILAISTEQQVCLNIPYIPKSSLWFCWL